jgi:hypothetical protein
LLLNEEDIDCGISKFWIEGFVALQGAINAAVIEVSTKCSMQIRVIRSINCVVKV